MKHQQFCELRSGKLVPQVSIGITFVDDLYLGHSRDHYKDLNDEKNSDKGLHIPLAMVYPKY